MSGRAKDSKLPRKPKVPKAKSASKLQTVQQELIDDNKLTKRYIKPKGRPTGYTKLADNVVRSMSILGKTKTEMADALGIDLATFYRWCESHPSFRENSEIGGEQAQVPVIKSLYERAIGYSHQEQVVKWHKDVGFQTMMVTKHYPPEVGAIELILTNKMPKHWKRKTEATMDVNVQIRRALLDLPDE